MLMVAWGVNLVEKQLATYFGGAVTLIGMLIAVGVRRGWFVDLLVQIPLISACRHAPIVRRRIWSKMS